MQACSEVVTKDNTREIIVIIIALNQRRDWFHDEGRLNIFSKKKVYSKCVLLKRVGLPAMKSRAN